jgi:SPP1 gp7 family putative phage head morphogenesis protein
MTPAALTPAERRAYRARVLAAAARRRRQPRIPAAVPPTAALAAHVALLARVSRELDALILAALAHAGLRLDAADGDPPRAPLLTPAKRDAALARARRALARATDRPALAGAIDAVGARTVRHARDQWRRQLQSALGITPTDVVPDLFVEGFRRRNLTLIRSLASDKVARVRQVLVDDPGARVEQVQQRIQDETGATASRAALIARDQVLKLNSEVIQAQHQAAGIREFTWSTSGDERVRESHRALEGQRFAYDALPTVDGDAGVAPGTQYQCRCVAIPIIPGVEDT